MNESENSIFMETLIEKIRSAVGLRDYAGGDAESFQFSGLRRIKESRQQRNSAKQPAQNHEFTGKIRTEWDRFFDHFHRPVSTLTAAASCLAAAIRIRTSCAASRVSP